MATVKRRTVKGGLARLNQAIKDLNKLDLQVGWFDSARYDDEDNTPVAQVAIDNEFGVPSEKIPPRPFLRPTVEKHQSEWKTIASIGIKRILDDKATAKDAMNILGLAISGQIRVAITRVTQPRLAPITIAHRLNERADKQTIGLLDKPLIFEGILLNSTSYIVQNGPVITPPPAGG